MRALHSQNNCHPEVVQTDYLNTYIESPFVDCEIKSIYFCDITIGATTLFRYDICSGILYGASFNNSTDQASSCVPIKGSNDQFICNFGACICHVKWDGISPTAYRTKEIYCLDPALGTGTDWGKTSPKGTFHFSSYSSPTCGVVMKQKSMNMIEKPVL